MKKILLHPSVVELLKNFSNYTDSKGILPLLSSHVKEFKIGKRFVYTLSEKISPSYKHIIRAIHTQNLAKIPVNQSATAYLKGKSYFDFIEPHRNNYFFIKLDLKNFFHSISEDVIKSNFLEYFSDEIIFPNSTQTHAEAIYNLIKIDLSEKSSNKRFIKKSILPVGFPLSPIISNIVFRKIDLLIEKFCDEKNIVYTRYADDMLFSSKGKIEYNPFSTKNNRYLNPYLHSKNFYDEISFILSINNYKINKNKIKKSVHTMSLSGYTITGSNYSDIKGFISISNKKTKIISKLIHELKIENTDEDRDRDILKKCFSMIPPKPKYRKKTDEFIKKFCENMINNKLLGYRSFLISILKYDKNHDCINIENNEKYNKLLNEINIIIRKRLSLNDF